MKIIQLILISLIYFTTSQARPFYHGEINELLHTQALSHIAFHSDPIKIQLASLFPSFRSVAIVGVEWGEDVTLFAQHNYSVYAFEPVNKFVKHLQAKIDEHPEWDIKLFPVAAGNSSQGDTRIVYDNADADETVPMAKIEDHIDQPLAVLSLDIQGDELHVLEGALKLIPDRIASLWVEAIACNAKVHHILHALDNEYIAFDFVPWGMHKDQQDDKVPRSLQSFVYKPDRPTNFKEYLHWMCELSKDYKWLQTDLLFIRRDLMSKQVKQKLASFAEQHCNDKDVECLLRSLREGQTSEKEEL